MKVREFIERYCESHQNIGFIMVKPFVEEGGVTPRPSYVEAPIRCAYELLERNSTILEYYILNDAQPPISWLSGASWLDAFNNGSLVNLLVISPDDFKTMHPSDKDLIEFIDKKIIEKRGK